MSGEAPALLVVDDEEDNRYTLTRRLKREGYANLATAVNGRQALDMLAGARFDLVLLDIMMPEISGYDVLAYGAAAAVLMLVALAANLLPAMSASRVDPVKALRSE